MKDDQLPNNDYYTRPVGTLKNMDVNLSELIKISRERLYTLTQTFPGATAFSPEKTIQVIERITCLEKKINALPANNSEQINLKNRVVVLKDIIRINELHCLSIPQNDSIPIVYCTLSDAVGGATPKISLLRATRVTEQLDRLCAQSPELSLEKYIQEREQHALYPEAIIKLPKHGDIKEIQHEAVALHCARVMGLDTTNFIMVSYEDRPALFISFAPIRLLKDFTQGQQFFAGLGILGQTYTHFSTIKPLGNGVQADCTIDDFGNALALFYLCADPDAIGGYCQNKGLRDSKSLFIFDQSISLSSKFLLDTRISLQPQIFFATRHNIGRNLTLIEDSAFNTKYESLIQLKELKSTLLSNMDHILNQYQNKVKDKNTSQNTKKQLHLLIDDAKQLKERIEEQITALDTIFPQHIGSIDKTTLMHALILEKLINNPGLFSSDGRPYKNPWTQQHHIKITQIDARLKNEIKISFNKDIPEPIIRAIKRHGAELTYASSKTLNISTEHLLTMREDMLYPEHQSKLLHNIDYLHHADIQRIKEAYGTGNQEEINNIINLYRVQMAHTHATPASKLEHIARTEAQLLHLIESAKDKGFGKHILKKFYFEAQKALQLLMNPSRRPECIDEAFAAAIRLDRMAEFNEVVSEAVKMSKIGSPQFNVFLNSCIMRAKSATNYTQAQKESAHLALEAQKAMTEFKTGSATTLFQLLKEPGEIEALVPPDPLLALTEQLKKEHILFNESSELTASSVSVTDDLRTAPNEPGLKSSYN